MANVTHLILFTVNERRRAELHSAIITDNRNT
jgi:hypothetical protein